jgi:tetratricopeptide (TPR) repeat protein
MSISKPSQEQFSKLIKYYQNGQFVDAEKLAVSITKEFPEHQFAWKVLGVLFIQVGKLNESLNANQKSVELNPMDSEAHYNLGVILKSLDRINEAEASYKQAIKLKPDYAEAHSNLGNTLQELGRLDEAEKSFRQAITLKPNFTEAHSNLGKILYKVGYKDLALESIEKANNIDPQFQDARLLLKVMKSRKSREESETTISDTNNKCAKTGLTSNPLILNRVVEKELIANLYEMSSRELDKTIDARYGNGKCSPDFNLFHDSRSIIKSVAEDLTKIMMEAVKSEVYIIGSFFNILSAGGGSNPHNHLNDLDKDIGFDLGKQKYSLVYYLSVGDQHCSEPGILKLYEPREDILPCEGMITIIPASRMHSAVYGGKTDRVMIGVNFYSL